MKQIIEKYNLGVVANDFSPKALAEKIKVLTVEDINAFKSNSHKYAFELSGEHNERIILEEINKLVQK